MQRPRQAISGTITTAEEIETNTLNELATGEICGFYRDAEGVQLDRDSRLFDVNNPCSKVRTTCSPPTSRPPSTR